MSKPTQTKKSVESKKKGDKIDEKNYFGSIEENAVRMFLTASTFDEKNKIYNGYLKKPLDKMISSIIRRYKLYRKDMDFTEIHVDTHSFLMTKIDKFKPSKEKKAYSYFGTICKNYLMGQIIKDQKETNRKVSYEDISTDLENSPTLSYSIDSVIIDSEQVIQKFITELNVIIEDGDLNDNEYKLALGLIDLFENYKKVFLESSNNKFNKNVILLFLRDVTNLSTKEIRSSMKKFKTIYIDLVEELVK